jgi:cyclase
MFRKALASILFALALPPLAGGQVVKFEMVNLGGGVYAAIREHVHGLPVDGNTTVIVNDEDVVVVDTGVTPASARAVLAEIRKLTDKPVRYVINTHHHGDHINGNGVYRDAFPQAEFIGHEKMREDFLTVVPKGTKDTIEEGRKTLAAAPERLRTGLKESGEPMTERERAALAAEVEMWKKYLPEIEQTRLIAPTLTVGQELTLHRGGREIRLLYLGRGNTRGDLVVHLPRERVLVAGDLLVHPVPFAYESFISVGEWSRTMKRLRGIEADVIVPGHGPVQRDKEYLDLVAALLESVDNQTREAFRRGLSLEETRKVVDLERFRLRFAGEDRVRNYSFSQVLAPRLIELAYEEARGVLKRS